jgi:hypothetical protein
LKPWCSASTDFDNTSHERATYEGLAGDTHGSFLGECRLVNFIVTRFAIDLRDHDPGFDAGPRAGAVGQDNHRL